MSDFREIYTKAVCGKGKKFSQTAHSVTPTHKPSSVLGCWVINHKCRSNCRKDVVVMEGTYDINIWYSYNNSTKTEVVTETVTYRDEITLAIKDKNVASEQMEVVHHVLQEPNSLEAEISPSGKIVVQVEREFLVEVIGETKIKVNVDSLDALNDTDWDDDFDEAFEDLDSEFLVGELEE